MKQPLGIALDPAGHLWVDGAGAIVEYPAGANGNVVADRGDRRPAGELHLGDRL